MLVHDTRGHSNDVVAFPVLDEIEGLQGGHDVIGANAGQLRDVLDGKIYASCVQGLQNLPRPVAAIAHLQGAACERQLVSNQ